MRLGIDGRVVSGQFPGIGRYCLSLIRELLDLREEHDWFVIYDPGRNRELALLAEEERARADGSRARFVALPVAMRSAGEQVALPALLAQLRLDLFHATYYALPPLLPGRIVVTLYDLIPQLYPGYWSNPALHRVITTWGALALRRANALLTLSAATRDDLYRYYGTLAQDKPITVTPCGADARFLGQATRQLSRFDGPLAADDKHAEARPYFLYVGSNKPHKNLPRLVEAFDLYRQGGGDGDLIVAGRWDARYPQAREEAARRGLGDTVFFRHDVDDSELAALYGDARGFVFPSLYEGFGFPVLEAMAAAAPVLTGDSSSLPEVGGDAVLYCDVGDPAAIAAGMARLAGDPALRARLVRAGHQRAQGFTWRRTAEATLAAYEAALV